MGNHREMIVPIFGFRCRRPFDGKQIPKLLAVTEVELSDGRYDPPTVLAARNASDQITNRFGSWTATRGVERVNHQKGRLATRPVLQNLVESVLQVQFGLKLRLCRRVQPIDCEDDEVEAPRFQALDKVRECPRFSCAWLSYDKCVRDLRQALDFLCYAPIYADNRFSNLDLRKVCEDILGPCSCAAELVDVRAVAARNV